MLLLLEIVSEENHNPYADALVYFYDVVDRNAPQKNLKWFMRGRFDGYKQHKDMFLGYVELPIKGDDENVLYQDMSIGEVCTTYPIQSKRTMRMYWDILQKKGFRVEDPPTEDEFNDGES